MAHESGSAAPRFRPGDRVRVRYGVTVPDFEDIPLGDWSGTIETVEQLEDQIAYEIEWDRRTLKGMHPVYRKRCERDGLEPERKWLGEEDLEADDGTPVPIEQPTEIKTPPLSAKDRDDRVRAVFGLTHDEPLPDVSREALLAYHRYLSGQLRFPLSAIYGEEEVGPYSRRRTTMTVTGLLDPDDSDLTVEDGLICTGYDRGEVVGAPLSEVEIKKKDPNFRLVSDYAYWFHNWPCRDDGDTGREDFDEDRGPEVTPSGMRLFTKAVLVCGVGGGLLGATVGAALGAIQGAGSAALFGGVPLAMVGALVVGRYGSLFGAVNRLRYGPLLGAVPGLVGGGLVGVVAGLMVVSLPWGPLGCLAGMFLGPFVLPHRRRRLISLRAASLGACVGILISAFQHDRARVAAGAIPGLITGSIIAAGLVLLLVGAVSMMPRSPSGYHETDEYDDEAQGEDDPVAGGGGGLHPRRT